MIISKVSNYINKLNNKKISLIFVLIFIIIFIIIILFVLTFIIKIKLNNDNFIDNKKYYFSIGCLFKNESHGLYEFIEHHLYHGIDHIYLINDNSDDNFMKILNPYIANGQVTLFHNDIDSTVTYRQPLIYNKYLKDILNNTTWLGIIDLDEYLYSPKDINIKNILKKYETDYDNIKVEWITFGSNNHDLQPLSIVEGFNKHCNLKNIEENTKTEVYNYKSIMKADKILNFHVHYSDLSSNKTINLSYTTNNNELYINHYKFQSKDFYTKIKATRGDSNNYRTISDRNLEEFNELNKIVNVIEDNKLIKQNKDIIKKVKDYKNTINK